MGDNERHVCPVEKAGRLDNRIRRWFQHPQKILGPYIAEGMTVLDLGCGSGFFTIDMARMVGESGRVIASDLQQGMLQKLGEKIQGTGFEDRITLHKCEETRIGVSEDVDFVLAFYMLHEVGNQKACLMEIGSILKPNGRLLIVEPPLHVSTAAFTETIRTAQGVGLRLVDGPRILLSKTAMLARG
jgi:ubiquinone/menaquinone biosynthesis C-methylase UbiE